MLEERIKEAISGAFDSVFNHAVSATELALQPTRKDFEGTYTFVTFPYLKVTKMKPEEAGQKLGDWLLGNTTFVAGFNVVKGFLNLEITPETWAETLVSISEDENFGILPSNGQKVMVEFSSPNTNKPLHLGHLRNNFWVMPQPEFWRPMDMKC